jgi:hypothetical protein
MNYEATHCLRELKALASRLFFRALCDYVNYKAKWGNGEEAHTKKDQDQKENFDSAKQWFNDSFDYDDDWILSFESVCDMLEWDSEWVRQKLETLEPADLRRVQKKCGLV